MRTLAKTPWILTALLTLAACGGGETSNAPTATPSASSKAAIASGPIATFGSIVVNGVHYNTDNASFNVNDISGTQGDLSVGQIVTVKGTIDSSGKNGTASEVTFDDTVKGPVESIDTVGQQLVVLGQTVLVGAATSFDDGFSPASLDGVSVGQIVEVSGQIDATGNIAATRIEPKPPATQFEVHGTVSNLDAANSLFNINALVVDFSSALLDNFTAGQINDGDFVEAKGTSLGAAGELLATKVELESLLPGAVTGDFVELEGFITRFDSSDDFDVSNMPVTTNSSTVFVGGDENDLGLNIKIEAEGVLDSDGTLVASKIDIRRAKAIRISAMIDSVDAATNAVVVLGITIKVDNLTRMEDKGSANISPLGVSDINAGDFIEARGSEMPAGSGEVLAARFEREDADQRSILQGFVESISDPTFSILGVTIETNSSTIFNDGNGNVISSTDFFTQLGPNSLVKAKGSEVSDTTILATEVEFEIED